MQQVKKALCFCLLFLSFAPFLAYPTSQFNAENVSSIKHFKSYPLVVAEGSDAVFLSYSEQDKEGYLWTSSSHGVQRYDGGKLRDFPLIHSESNIDFNSAYLFADSYKNIWAADTILNRFNHESQKFEGYSITSNKRIHAIAEDHLNRFWIGGDRFGLIYFDPLTRKTLEHITFSDIDNAPLKILSLAYENRTKTLWIVSRQGVFSYQKEQNQLKRHITPLDESIAVSLIRDIVMDDIRSELWITSPDGLLRINTITNIKKLYSATEGLSGLPSQNVTTSFIDSASNLWIGLEKQGICVFKYSTERFICLPTNINTATGLPAATVEDVSEDDNGSLWLAMNSFGMRRITPSLEGFTSLEERFSLPSNYFPNSFEPLLVKNSELWVPTDGGGINIFNLETGQFSNLRHSPMDDTSIPSDSVISIAKDEFGFIWAGTWEGGVSRIDPNTKTVVEIFNFDSSSPSNKVLRANSVFNVLPDMQGGIWLSVWGHGFQYYDFNTKTFTNYLTDEKNGIGGVNNVQITHMQLYDNKLFIAGENSLEYLDLATQTIHPIYWIGKDDLSYVLVDSYEEIWIASSNGLIKLNMLTNESKVINESEGLSNKRVNYLFKDDYGKLWIATNKGISILDTKSNELSRYFKRDGLVHDVTSAHGEFTVIEDQIYIPTQHGIGVVNLVQQPKNTTIPKTKISQVNFLDIDTGERLVANRAEKPNDKLNRLIKVPYTFNTAEIEFSALSYIHPNFNQFKYRLYGLQNEFRTVAATNPVVRFNHLPAGTYRLEVFAANSSGIWDDKGATYSFFITKPWWQTYIAIACMVLMTVLFIFVVIKWKLSVNSVRQKRLEERVEQRTSELQKEINDRKKAESKLFHLAFHDSLTGLGNRQKVIEIINACMQQAKTDDSFNFGILLLDGDRFKYINDTYGHIIGDKLLIACSQRIQQLLGFNHFMGRLGGDEFIVLIKNISEEELHAFANRTIQAFTEPFAIGHYKLQFSLSIGVLLCDKRYQALPNVLRHADIAMYHAKQAGKGRYRLFDLEMQKAAQEYALIENGLTKAIENNEFRLVYQPIVDIQQFELSGFEALIRWQHPQLGPISPDVFISIAEETGKIAEIGRWVLEEACNQLVRWHNLDADFKPTVSVNLSLSQLRSHKFLNFLYSAIKNPFIEPKFLKLELTETVLMENFKELNEFYAALDEGQIDLVIDDFGTGYSSLAYLIEIPAKILKIDRKFVSAIEPHEDQEFDNDAVNLLDSTVTLAKTLNKKVTAEGIETKRQLLHLIDLKCNYAQGFYLFKPMEKDDATSLIMGPEKVSDIFRDLGLKA